MKSIVKEHNYSLVFVSLLIAGLCFLLPVKIVAQVAVAAKTKSVKSKKILYGLASFYSSSFNGKRTASGEIFSQNKFTCACNVLPLRTWIRVTNLRNGRSVVVKTNDRLHPKMKRLVDLTKVAAVKLGYVSTGLTKVKVEVLGKKPPQ